VVKIEVHYFAALRDSSGVAMESVTTSCQTLCDLYDELRGRYGFKLLASQVKVAVNGDWSGMEKIPAEGDVIVFLPPVAGG
jgi:molybdopterin synthase sulfur carrier subunit